MLLKNGIIIKEVKLYEWYKGGIFMKDKKRWRVWYENFKSPDIQERLEELKVKVQNKTISREEYAEYQNMQKVMNNLPKVDNLIEFIDRLEEELEAYKGEYITRENKANSISLEDLEKEMNLNMQKQDEFIAKRKEINKKIAASTDKEEIAALQMQKEDIDQELSKLRFQADKNNQEFAKIKNEKPQSQQSNNKLSRYSNEELRTKCFQISSMKSKCDMVATNLMKGLSIDSIQVKLEGWKDKKFTAKDPLPLTRAEKLKAKQDKKQESEKSNVLKEEIQKENNKTEGDKSDSDITTKLPVEVSDFEKEFPRLAKRFPNMKDNLIGKTLLRAKKFFRTDNSEEVKQQDSKQEDSKNETTEVNQKKKQNELFRDYLKYDVLEVAQKGVEQVREERIAQKREEAKKAQEAKNKSDDQTR